MVFPRGEEPGTGGRGPERPREGGGTEENPGTGGRGPCLPGGGGGDPEPVEKHNSTQNNNNVNKIRCKLTKVEKSQNENGKTANINWHFTLK